MRTLPGTSVSVPALDLGVIPQPEGTWNFCDSFVYTREILRRGDLVIGNLETMVSQSSPLGMQIHRLEDKPYLNAPASYLDALKYAGYDLLTMANNHNVDTGLRGIYETLRNVNDWGFMHTGLFSSESDDRYSIVEVNGMRIGMVSYAAFYNDKDSNLTESGQDVLLNRYASDKAKADIRAARKAGAEFVIAFIHWGAENTHDTTWNQEQYARTLARAGADYIVGSHPHALQRYDIIETSDGREVPVIYSMGNFLSNMQRDINNDTMILQLNLQREGARNRIQRHHINRRSNPIRFLPHCTAAGAVPLANRYVRLRRPGKSQIPRRVPGAHHGGVFPPDRPAAALRPVRYRKRRAFCIAAEAEGRGKPPGLDFGKRRSKSLTRSAQPITAARS